MVLRVFQIAAVVFLVGVVTVRSGTPAALFETYWREALFALITTLAVWLFLVTHLLRPVVTVFAAVALFLIATMEDPSPGALQAALDRLTEKALTGVDGFRKI